MFRTSLNQTGDGTRRGTSLWNSGSTIDKQWKRPGSHPKGAERRTTTRTVWTWTVRDGRLSTRSSSWMAEAIRYASADFENTAMDVGLCIGHTRGDAVRGAPGRMPDREIPRVWCRFEAAPLD